MVDRETEASGVGILQVVAEVAIRAVQLHPGARLEGPREVLVPQFEKPGQLFGIEPARKAEALVQGVVESLVESEIHSPRKPPAGAVQVPGDQLPGHPEFRLD